MRSLVLVAASLLATASAGSNFPAWAYAKAQAALAKMSLTEKLTLVHGTGKTSPYVGDVPATANFPVAQALEDGPQGVADGVTGVTAWPSALTVAMTWDPEAAYEFGQGMAVEQRIKGTNVMLGPGLNLQRVPWGGRTFEYMSGEDPVLAATMLPAEIAGIQSQNISANAKHFVCNNQEYNRNSVSENVPQRAFMELYTPGFQAAVDAGVGSIMCSYNRINRTYACENEETLGWLKNTAGFDGWVMSDWGATHSTVQAANSGLDQQMPDYSFFGSALADAVAAGNVTEARIDDMVTRMLVPFYALNIFEYPPTGNISAPANSVAHNTLARTLAERSMTLLQNNGGLLPLDVKAIKSIAVFGDQTTVTGGGSGGVQLPYVVTPYQGIVSYVNNGLPPRPANCQFLNDTDYYQPGNPCVQASSLQDCCVQCTNNTACSYFAYVAGSQCSGSGSGGGACWLKSTNEGQRVASGVVAGNCAPFPAGAINVTYMDGSDPVAAAALAASVDVAVVVVATSSHEGADRTNLSLPLWHDQLVEAVAAAQPKTVVVARCPGSCLMPWKASVPSILFQLMPGQEAGNALANALFGAVNPSGKLPVSFPNNMSDTWLGNNASSNTGYPANPAQYPGLDYGNGFLEAEYSEELLVGYRWYDAQNIEPQWPFGHGLSYTTFGYSGLAVSGSVSASSTVTISVNIANTGAVAGSEAVQLYISHPAAAAEPPKSLKAFFKVNNLAPGASQKVTFTLAASDLQVWNVFEQSWQLIPGTYQVLVGSSSRDIRQQGTFTATA